MERAVSAWWQKVRIQQKVWTILLVVFIPLVCALLLHVYFVRQLQASQQRHQQIVLAREQVQVLTRLAVDIEDAFRGYLLTQQDKFLRPLQEAEPKLKPIVQGIIGFLDREPELTEQLMGVNRRLEELLESKHALIERIRQGREEEVLRYVRSGHGLVVSDAVRRDLRIMENELYDRLRGYKTREHALASIVSIGLLVAVGGIFVLGLLHARLLSRSITSRLERVQEMVARVSAVFRSKKEPTPEALRTGDEIDELARTFEAMAGLLQGYLGELEALNTIGHEISTIRTDGLQGVLQRITDRAVELLKVDVCLVMVRHDRMGCWIVEAASEPWKDQLEKAVMLWEEFPVAVRAFESREPAYGEDFWASRWLGAKRANVIGRSALSVPLLFQGEPFGVLVFLLQRMVAHDYWNVRMAKSFADEAAIAIVNARLYETAHRKEKVFESRLKQLEHLAETLAHDMKGPGERVNKLATLLSHEYGSRLEAQAQRWLHLISEEAQELSARIQGILEVARVGVRPESLEAVDPKRVLAEVLKENAGELERRGARIHMAEHFPMVACHRAYLRQVFDNLIGNALKFTDTHAVPEIHVTVRQQGNKAFFSVRDNGPGIPQQCRARAFEPFVRLRTDVPKGSGIGLTIVKHIVELYGGEVWIEPEGPPGCTVTFSLNLLMDGSHPPGGLILEEP